MHQTAQRAGFVRTGRGGEEGRETVVEGWCAVKEGSKGRARAIGSRVELVAACLWGCVGVPAARDTTTLVAHEAHVSLRSLPRGADNAVISTLYESFLLLLPLVGAEDLALLGGAMACVGCSGAVVSACTFFFDFFFFDDVALPLPCNSSNALNVLAIRPDHTSRSLHRRYTCVIIYARELLYQQGSLSQSALTSDASLMLAGSMSNSWMSPLAGLDTVPATRSLRS